MSGITISNLSLDGDFIKQLTKEELKLNIYGGKVLVSGSANAGRISRYNGIENGGIVGASFIASGDRPFDSFVGYSFDPLTAYAGIRSRS